MAEVPEQDLKRLQVHVLQLRRASRDRCRTMLDQFFSERKNRRVYRYFVGRIKDLSSSQLSQELRVTWARDLFVRGFEEQDVIILDSYFRTVVFEREEPPDTGSYLSDEVREWAKEQSSPEELAAGLKEVLEKGGVEMGEAIERIKHKQEARERPNP